MFGWLKNIRGNSTQRRTVRTVHVPLHVRSRYDAAATTDENRRHWANADLLSAGAANNPAVLYTDAPANGEADPIEAMDLVELERRMATVLPGGWPVIVDLAGMAIPSQNRPIRFGHDMQSGVGHTEVIQIDNGKLLASGMVSRDTAAAREIVTSARNGFPWQASIGARVLTPEHRVVASLRW